MKTLLLLILLQIYPVQQPTYQFKSTSAYPVSTQVAANNIGDNSYTPSNSNRPGPKRVSGWGIIDWLTWGQFNGVPYSATNSQMYDYYYYIQNGGKLSYNDWLNSQAVPIGDVPLILIISMSGLYIFVKKLKKSERIALN